MLCPGLASIGSSEPSSRRGGVCYPAELSACQGLCCKPCCPGLCSSPLPCCCCHHYPREGSAENGDNTKVRGLDEAGNRPGGTLKRHHCLPCSSTTLSGLLVITAPPLWFPELDKVKRWRVNLQFSPTSFQRSRNQGFLLG